MFNTSFTRPGFSGRRRQHGIALILVTVAAVAIIGMAGLALDMGFAFINKSRLQAATDAAALSGAKILDNRGTSGEVVAAAEAEFALSFPDSDASLVVELSPTLSPWAAGGANPRFVRVTATNHSVAIRLARVVPGVGNSLDIGGSAVAGITPLGGQICGVIPVVFCATNPTDTNCGDGQCYGYPTNANVETTITGANNNIGPGNYAGLALGGTGAADYREGLAGKGELCVTQGGTATTEPGVQSGPVSQGINTRFGQYQGPVSQADYPPDVVVQEHQPTPANRNFYYNNYLSCVDSEGCSYNSNGVVERRVVPVPMGDCSTPLNGRTQVRIVGVACFFLTRTAQGGTIYGQFVGSCNASGTPGSGGSGGGGPEDIMLFKNPDSNKT